ncbi:conserved membrane hypothetical protein [Tenacibaculum sp. 190524A05c]|uniref:Uncharacterized protein n=1 Tax=Tenacibaculum platacis TaxID=3137852 RepID=A0ABM9P450_9FLAO
MKIEYIELLLQVITALLSLFYFIKYNGRFLFILTVLTVLSAITELVGAYRISINKTAFSIYHFYSFFQFSIITFMYLKLIRDKRKEKLFVILPVIFISLWLGVFYRSSLFSYLIIIIAISVSIYVFLYLRELLLSDRILNYRELLPFWISVGFLVYYLPSIPFFTLYKYMQNRGLFFILHILIILMNLFIIYGLIWSKREKRYL